MFFTRFVAQKMQKATSRPIFIKFENQLAFRFYYEVGEKYIISC